MEGLAPPFGAAEVTGPSMVPTLQHGDRLVVQYGARVGPGDVVVLRHPFQQDLLVVKRIAERREGGCGCSGTTPTRVGTAPTTTVPEDLVLGRCVSATGPTSRVSARRSRSSAGRSAPPGRCSRRSASRRLRAR